MNSSIDKKLEECLYSFQQIDQNVFDDIISQKNTSNNQFNYTFQQILPNQSEDVKNNQSSTSHQRHHSHYQNATNNSSSTMKIYPHQRNSKCHEQNTDDSNNQPLFHQSYPINGRNNSLINKLNINNNQSYKKDNSHNKDLVTDSTRITTGTMKLKLHRSIDMDHNPKKQCLKKGKGKGKDNQQWSFSPIINEKSKLICSKLPSTSKERLLMEKQKYHKKEIYISESALSPYAAKSFYDHDKTFNPSGFVALYERGVKIQNNKRNYIEQIKQQRKECSASETTFSFRPWTNAQYQSIDERWNAPVGSLNNFIQKNKEYEIRKTTKINQLKRHRVAHENSLHTFKPEIYTSKSIVMDDVNTIDKQVPLINDYVSSIRQYRGKTKLKEKEQSIPISVSERKFSISPEKKIKRIRNIKNVDYYRAVSPNHVLQTRSKFGLNDFFMENCYSSIGEDFCSKSLMLVKGNKTMNSTGGIDKITSASIDY